MQIESRGSNINFPIREFRKGEQEWGEEGEGEEEHTIAAVEDFQLKLREFDLNSFKQNLISHNRRYCSCPRNTHKIKHMLVHKENYSKFHQEQYSSHPLDTKLTSKDSKIITMRAYIAKILGHATKTILREKNNILKCTFEI